MAKFREQLKVVLIRCPQPLLVGADTSSLYSPNRSLTPEPTLPQLAGIIQKYTESREREIDVVQLDLRDPRNGSVAEVHYGDMRLSYIQEPIAKIYHGVSLEDVRSVLEGADVVGFTNNFAMSRGVVCDHISRVRKMFPALEIWVGGRDLFTSRIEDVYATAAGGDCVIFAGHVFQSLPAYLDKMLGLGDDVFGITVYKNGRRTDVPSRPLTQYAEKGVMDIPLPLYQWPESLGHFTGSGEGNCFGDRFVHMTISHGCPYACGYCTTGYRERYLVHKSMETIRAELEMYKRIGVKTIAIMDDNLLALGPVKVREIMGIVNQHGFAIEYGNGLMLSALGEHWESMAESVFKNCVSLYAPLEDLTTDCMYEKLSPIQREKELMVKIAKAGFSMLKYVTMGVIVGVPGHKKHALKRNFTRNMQSFLGAFFNSDLDVAITVFNYMPLPGTVFGDQALDSGRMVVDDPFRKDPEVCSFGTTSYAPDGMTHKDVFKIYEQALNVNPAGKEYGVSYVNLQRLGAMAFQPGVTVPDKYKIPGVHMRARVSG